MTRFVQLTAAGGNPNVLWVNMGAVCCMWVESLPNERPRTVLSWEQGGHAYVLDSPEQILALIATEEWNRDQRQSTAGRGLNDD